MMSLNFADHIAAAMTEVRRNWQVPGCRRMLLDYAHEASTVPPAEIGAAALIYAQTPSYQVPSLELFRAGPHWRNSVEHARTLRPADHPRCTIHPPETLPCRWCESERKAEEYPAAPVVMLDDEQRQINARWVEKIRAATRVERAGTGAGEAADPAGAC